MRRIETLVPLTQNDIFLHTVVSCPQNAKGKKPVLLLLHFWGGSNQTYTSLINHLEHNYNGGIIAPSLRGWGHSSKPNDPEAYRIVDYANDIEALIRQSQKSQPEIPENGIVLIGHSMGGKIAQCLLARKSIRSLLKGCVLLAPAPTSSFALPEDMREQQIHAYDNAESARFVIQNVLLGQPENVGAGAWESLVADAVSGAEEAKQAWPSYGMAEDHQSTVTEAIQETKSKFLIVVGSLDRVETPDSVRSKVASPLTDAGSVVKEEVLEGVGHLTPVEAPKQLATAIISFIKSLGTNDT